jgi:hypothetical protein
MSASRIFASVTADLVHRIKQDARDKHGVLFDTAEGTAGTATGRTPFGDLIVHFVHDSAQAALAMTLVKKPMVLPSALLWKAFDAELERKRGLV